MPRVHARHSHPLAILVVRFGLMLGDRFRRVDVASPFFSTGHLGGRLITKRCVLRDVRGRDVERFKKTLHRSKAAH
jgi:hypothetical protein